MKYLAVIFVFMPSTIHDYNSLPCQYPSINCNSDGCNKKDKNVHDVCVPIDSLNSKDFWGYM